MKRLVVILSLAAAASIAQEYPGFVALMKAAGQANAALAKMETKTGPQAMRAAERLGTVYEQTIPFWRGRNAEAAKIAIAGKAAATDLAAAAYAGDAERAESAYKALTGTCKTCHEARREKLADGRYLIK